MLHPLLVLLLLCVVELAVLDDEFHVFSATDNGMNPYSSFGCCMRSQHRTRTTVKYRRSRSFKVTGFGTYLKLICDFLLVSNTNLHRILHRFRGIAELLAVDRLGGPAQRICLG